MAGRHALRSHFVIPTGASWTSVSVSEVVFQKRKCSAQSTKETDMEPARSVLYLASDDAAFVTGTASLVDGGASITRT
jgi:NAD(P)-dependent dehydrogenase (short-subunit alcohol dehydrogenase family)